MPRLRGLIAVAAAAAAAAADFFVDCVHGSDSGSGSAASPFLTPNRARDAVRALQPLSASATVHLLPGSCYPRNAAGGIDFTQPVLTLNNATVDSAPAGTTITWIAEGGPGSVRFMGGLVLDPQYWTPSAGKPGVFQYDLGATGYDFATFGFGSLASGGLGQCVNNQAELFFNSQPQTLARWPNIDPTTGYFNWVNINTVVNSSSFTVASTRPIQNNWGSEPDAWIHGYWSFDWADSFVKLQSAVPTSKPGITQLTSLASTPPVYGYLPKARFYGVNILAELDTAGEYYIDKTGNGTLYYFPASPSDLTTGEAVISMAQNVIVLSNTPSSAALLHPSPYQAMRAAAAGPSPSEELASVPSLRTSSIRRRRAASGGSVDAATAEQEREGLRLVRAIEAAAAAPTPGPLSNLVFNGIAAQFSRGIALGATVVTSVSFLNMDLSYHGQKAASVYAAASVTMNNITALGLGCSVIGLGGGNQATLQSGGNVLSNSRFDGYARVCRTYQPAIAWSGVGNSFSGNEISNAPHSGILGGGVSNTFTANFLHDLCFEVSDSGSWYAGRSWVNRGNIVANNTFLRIQQTVPIFLGAPAVQAIYLDDQLSGQSVVNNTIIDSHTGLLLGGGRDNYVHGNVFKNLSSGLAMTFDNRGMNWQESSCAYNATYTGLLVQQLYSVNYQQPPYSTAFPELPGLLQNHPCVPVNNTISSNQWCQCSQGFIDRTANVTESWFSTVVDNVQISC